MLRYCHYMCSVVMDIVMYYYLICKPLIIGTWELYHSNLWPLMIKWVLLSYADTGLVKQNFSA